MPLIRYDNKKFEPASLETIAKAVVICKEYMADGYTLTLRQLYYQFVARGFIENSIHSYKRLGSLINDARLALNMKQVRQYNPPPNPAKLTDSRAKDYIEKFGDESWELDALDPKVIDRLISKAIEALIDPDPWAEMQRNEEKARKRIAEVAGDLRDEQGDADEEAEEE